MVTDTQYLVQVSKYFLVGFLALLLWDVVDNDITGYRLFITKRGFPSGPGIAYIISRIGTVLFVLTLTIFSTAPTGNCTVFNRAVHVWCPLAISFSAYLFFLRLRAVYSGNRPVIAAFFVLWLGLVATTILVPIGIDGGAAGDTDYCMVTGIAPSVSSAQISPIIYDTLVFVAISWRLARTTIEAAETNFSGYLRVVFFGEGLPAFTRSILIDGQIYYLLTLLAGIIANIFIFAPQIPPPLRSLGNAPYVAIVNIMACRVYRRTRAVGTAVGGTWVGSTKPVMSEKLAFGHPRVRSNSEAMGSTEATQSIQTVDSDGRITISVLVKSEVC